MHAMAETMVKATVGETVNNAIESIQEEFDLTKPEATLFLLQEGHKSYHSKADKERIQQ